MYKNFKKTQFLRLKVSPDAGPNTRQNGLFARASKHSRASGSGGARLGFHTADNGSYDLCLNTIALLILVRAFTAARFAL